MNREKNTGGIDPDALEPTIDLDLKTQKQILLLEARLATDDYYQLLGISRRAEKKEIRSAYFDCMNRYHADKFFGKNLGAFPPRMQKIVTALTKASDVLSRNKTRAEYDHYLDVREKTLGARHSVAPKPLDSEQPEADLADFGPNDQGNINVIPKAPRTPDLGIEFPADPLPPLGVAISERAPQSSNPTPTKSSRSDAARRMLARKMGRKSPVAPAAASAKASPEQVKQAVSANLKARYDARKSADKNRSQKYVEQAEAAKASGDWASAVGALRLAVELDPEKPQLRQMLERFQDEADRALAPKFAEQARYEEKEGLYDRAARSYERAARGKQSPELFHTGAKCLLKLGNLPDFEARKAVELARQAVGLDNQQPDYRVTLARAYDVAGMRTSAVGELRRALEIAPGHNDAKELYKSLK